MTPNQSQTPLDQAMAESGLTNHDLAARLRSRYRLKTGESQVSRWRNGLRPGSSTRERVAKVLDREEGELWPR